MRQIAALFAVFFSGLVSPAHSQANARVAEVKNVADGAFAYPSYSKQHDCFVAQQKTGEFIQLYRVNTDRSVRQLTFDSANHIHPSVSANGQWVAFTKEVNGSRDVWRMDLSTAQQTNLSNTPGFSESHPTWAVADSLIVFNCNRYDSLQEISAIRLHDGRVKRLTDNREEDTYGSLSPNGKSLLYTKWLDGEKNPEIYWLRLGENTEIRLTNNEVRDIAPVWLSDSVISYTQNGAIVIHHLFSNEQKRLTTAEVNILFVRGVPFGKSAYLCERVKERQLDGISLLYF